MISATSVRSPIVWYECAGCELACMAQRRANDKPADGECRNGKGQALWVRVRDCL